MRCRRAHGLLPLYVENDLPSDLHSRIRGHLIECPDCNRLASEYRSSQAWLLQHTLPEVSDDLLRQLRTRILEDIRTVASPPRGWARGLRPWAVMGTAALSLTLLLLLPTTEREAPPLSSAELGGSKPAIGEAPPPRSTPPLRFRPESAREPQSGPKVDVRRTRDRGSTRAARATAERRAADPAGDRLGHASSSQIDLQPAYMRSNDSRQRVLRTEIQTIDPNIRIIWFTPARDTDSLPDDSGE
jgi:hypothetical protein